MCRKLLLSLFDPNGWIRLLFWRVTGGGGGHTYYASPCVLDAFTEWVFGAASNGFLRRKPFYFEPFSTERRARWLKGC